MEDKFLAPAPFSNGSDWVKITSAVYRLLDFFPEGEPLKNRAKDKALAITENLVSVFNTQGWVSLKTCLPAGRDKAVIQLLEDIEILLNYLKLAKSFGWIDNINFLIISKGYENIRGQVRQSAEKPLAEPIQGAENASIIAQTQKITFQKTVENQISFTEKKINQSKAPEFLISDRQKKILQILSEKGKAQVSDFKLVLGDVTKRTIRRDLDELLKNRKIIRVGEWNQVFYEIGQG